VIVVGEAVEECRRRFPPHDDRRSSESADDPAVGDGEGESGHEAVKALEPEAQVCGVVAVSGEGVVSAESVVDVRRDTGEDAVVVVLIDRVRSSCVLGARRRRGT
jgi:hypothetical protein